MAALIRHGLRKGGQAINTCGNIFTILTRNKSRQLPHRPKPTFKPNYKMPYNKKKSYRHPEIKFDSTGDSIAAKGFNRPLKHYDPPQDVSARIQAICQSFNEGTELPLNVPEVKFNFLNACCEEFQHAVPNSLLSSMNTVDDVLEFYQTPVERREPLDLLKSMELPENLHIQTDYVRFHPETDTKFDGVSAFPKSSTIVTGLRYKKKYRGYIAEGLIGRSWPHE